MPTATAPLGATCAGHVNHQVVKKWWDEPAGGVDAVSIQLLGSDCVCRDGAGAAGVRAVFQMRAWVAAAGDQPGGGASQEQD